MNITYDNGIVKICCPEKNPSYSPVFGSSCVIGQHICLLTQLNAPQISDLYAFPKN